TSLPFAPRWIASVVPQDPAPRTAIRSFILPSSSAVSRALSRSEPGLGSLQKAADVRRVPRDDEGADQRDDEDGRPPSRSERAGGEQGQGRAGEDGGEGDDPGQQEDQGEESHGQSREGRAEDQQHAGRGRDPLSP